MKHQPTISLLRKGAVLLTLTFSLSACGSSDDDQDDTSAVQSAGQSTDQNTQAAYIFTTQFLGEQMALDVIQNEDQSSVFAFSEADPLQMNQHWIVAANDDGSYRIHNDALGTGSSLDSVNDGVFDTLTMAQTGAFNGQFWQITALENGYCRLTNAFLGSEIALDVTAEDRIITMRPVGDFSGQHWQIENDGAAVGLIDGLCAGN